MVSLVPRSRIAQYADNDNKFDDKVEGARQLDDLQTSAYAVNQPNEG